MKYKMSADKKKLIVVSMIEPVGGRGGNEFYDFGLCEALGKYCDIHFYTCSETVLHERYNLTTKTFKFYKNIYGDANFAIRGLRYILASFKTALHSRRSNAKIAHVHIYHFAWRELIIIFLCKIFLIKVVATIHDVESFTNNSPRLLAALRFIKFLPFIDRYIVHSRYACENLKLISAGMINNKLSIVSHGDTDFLYAGGLNKQDARNGLMIPENKKIILFFGQIKKVKGLDILLRAFSFLVKEDPDYHLLVIGRPWKLDGQIIRKEVSELGIDSHVTLNMTYIKNEDIPKYFIAADIVVLPYLKIYSSGVLMRALDYGTPVVVSDLPPLTDIVRDGENGRVFRSGDSEHLKTVIKEIIHTPFLLKKYAEAGKETIRDNYSWDVIAQQTFSVYKSI